MMTGFKEVSVGEVTTPGGQTIVKEFQSQSATEFLDTLGKSLLSFAQAFLPTAFRSGPTETELRNRYSEPEGSKK
jgi:23S rRNA U2552 (ribose-2'-O)-methylase RlmE/FtsJ